MPRLSALIVLGLFVVACSASEASPLLPRPVVVEQSTTTTTFPTTTTRAETLANAGPACATAFCLVYHINPDAEWSDGDPVTAADFAYTVALHQDPNLSEREPAFDLVESTELVDEKTIRLSFVRPFGPWQTLFSRVFREDESADDIVDLSTSGPFVFERWTEGDQLTVTRDQEWWSTVDPISGQRPGDVSEITFVFIESLDDMVDALRDGDVDVISARPDVATIESLQDEENIAMALAPGPFWEHIDFHHDDPMLSQAWVRKAIAMAIDREEILDRTVRLLDPSADPLDNTVFMANSENYEPHFEIRHDPDRAESLLETNGCVRGQDGIYVCGNVRMSFVWATTTDDPARAETFSIVRDDLEAIGIELQPDFRSPSSFVTREFLFGDPDVWQLINFSWRARSDPRPANATYRCNGAGELNVNRYCSEEVEGLIQSTETLVDPSERAAVYNEADRIYLEDVAVIPLYQKPVLLAWNTELSGPEPNFNLSADLWNIASWSGKESIVVALPSEPDEINPVSQADDNANLILGALMYGAFGMSPSQEYTQVLVDSVEVIEGRG